MSFRPTPLAVALAAVLAQALFLGVVLNRPELFCLALVLLVALLRGAIPPSTRLQKAELAMDTSTRSEGDELVVTVTAVLAGDHAGPIQILLVRPSTASAVGPGEHPVLQTSPDGVLRWDFRFRCESAGIVEFHDLHFRSWDPSGLWVGETRHDVRAAVHVQPRADVVRRAVLTRRTGAPFGSHTSVVAGEGIEFADIRPFVSGDRLSHINWRASLRRGVPHVNRFHIDRQADVILLIDTCADVGRRPNSALDHMRRAAAGLAAVHLRQHDRVGLLEYGGVTRSTRLAAGRSQYQRILNALTRSQGLGTELRQELTALPNRVLPPNALVIALTPLLDERFRRAVRRLAERGQDIVLLALQTDELSSSLLPPSDVDALARRVWKLEREDRLRELRYSGIRAVHWPPGRPLEAVLDAVARPVAGRGARWCA